MPRTTATNSIEENANAIVNANVYSKEYSFGLENRTRGEKEEREGGRQMPCSVNVPCLTLCVRMLCVL